MTFFKKLSKKNIILIFLFCITAIFLYIQNNYIEITNITYKNDKIPFEFNNFRILHVSDLHNKEFGKNQKNLITFINNISPDVIVVTGDIIDKRRTDTKDMEISLSFIEQAIKIAPVYFSPGNHEATSKIYDVFKKKLTNLGVTVLEKDFVQINKESSAIALMGLQDPFFYNNKELFKTELENLKNESSNSFKILLSHRPEFIEDYAKANIDLVFSGHAHGGQVRLPFIGGLISPGQGFLPKYTSGIYYEENTALVVSRGLGNSLFPFRIFNRPQLIVLTLKVADM